MKILMEVKKENTELLPVVTSGGEEELTKLELGVKVKVEEEEDNDDGDTMEEPKEFESMKEELEMGVVIDNRVSPQRLKRRQSEILQVNASPTVKALVPNSTSLPQLSEIVKTESSDIPTPSSAGKASLTCISHTDEKKEEELDLANPHNLLVSYLREEGYQAKTRKSSTLSDFFLELKSEHIAAYDTDIVKAVRDRNIDLLRKMHEGGKTLQCSNRFGESLLHMACRRGFTDVVRFLLKEADVTLRVKDDFGRTPLHDACWSASPNFDLMELIIEHDPDLLLIEDVRGHSPFSYARRSHWKDWRDFLTLRRDSLRLNTFTD